jgi:hypothetical protein
VDPEPLTFAQRGQGSRGDRAVRTHDRPVEVGRHHLHIHILPCLWTTKNDAVAPWLACRDTSRANPAAIKEESLMDEQRTVTVWSANGLTVTARRGTDDNLVIYGQDLKSGSAFGTEVSEYEYGLTVAERDVPRLLAALNAPAEADILDVLAGPAGAEVVRVGESAWLAKIGVEPEFWSRTG